MLDNSMNNRQAALIAAASMTTTSDLGKSLSGSERMATRVIEQSALFKMWLDEQDAAEAEGRVATYALNSAEDLARKKRIFG